eukprot:TRINITY_DN4679_c0_g1_i1.p1 TRINITY_DN4679_c0_g1~~TRINITY_DN4679_c0_g1_i1.p1  ORF type:complete len:155 (+),score=10.70 TRINITY_DN4679_c0_g1_i1:208-672(+)
MKHITVTRFQLKQSKSENVIGSTLRKIPASKSVGYAKDEESSTSDDFYDLLDDFVMILEEDFDLRISDYGPYDYDNFFLEMSYHDSIDFMQLTKLNEVLRRMILRFTCLKISSPRMKNGKKVYRKMMLVVPNDDLEEIMRLFLSIATQFVSIVY